MSDTAFDVTAQALARRILRDLPADRPRTRADLDRVPGPVAQLLHARLDAQAESAAAVPLSPWVDADHDGVRAATRTWREAVRDAARFPADVWAPAVEQAVRMALSHVIWPAETLSTCVFENEEGALHTDTVLQRVRAFGPYPYLPEIAGRYVEAKGLERIDRAGLERLLRRIDRRMVGSFGPAEWMTLLGPLLDLAGPVGAPEGTVPAALLRPLFEAKDAQALAVRVASGPALSASELSALLTEVLAPADETVAPTAPSTDEPLPSGDEPPESEAPPPPTLGDADPVAEAAGPLPHLPDASASDDPETQPASEPDANLPLGSPTEAPPPLPDDASGAMPEPPLESAVEEAEAAAPPEPGLPPPPVIGSRYNDPAEAPVHDSGVLGPARAVEPAPEPDPALDTGAFIFSHVDDAGAPPADLPPTGPATAPLGMPHLPEPPALDTSEPPRPAPEADDEPLWQRLARERAAQDAAPPTASGPDDHDPDEAPLWMRFVAPDHPEAESTDRPPDSPAETRSLEALETDVLGQPRADDRREWFVAELFGGSDDDYRRTLEALDACRSYTEATRIVERDVYQAHRVNPYTDASVAFIDALQVQFTRRGQG